MQISELIDKRIVIVGFGKEGQDSFLFLQKKLPKKTMGIADKKKLSEFSKETQKLLKKTKLHLGSRYLNSLKKYDIIVRSPGVSLATIAPFVLKKQRITSQTALFFSNCESTIIGITGTKGKGTTASLIHQVLKRGGVRAFLIGNIGSPALSFLSRAKKNTVFIYELSSFQLLDMNQSPHIAVVLNLYPEHLDYHQSLASYKKAKANITKYQSPKDYLIYDSDNEAAARIANASKAKKILFHQKQRKAWGKLPFVASPAPAVIIGKMFGIDEKTITSAIKSFTPLPHRLEPVGTYKGITFVNDSMGTTPIAVRAAITTLGKDVRTIILGGQEKGKTSYKELAKTIVKSHIETVILFPNTGKEIWKEIVKADKKKRMLKKYRAQNMKQAVQLCYKHTKKGYTCLLSPAGASFNMFKDYKDRGEQFCSYAKEYAKNK